MNVLDLFSGIGGFSLGLERAGFRTVAFCEIEPYCRAVLSRHWPGVPILGDIRDVTAKAVADATRDVRAEPTTRGTVGERVGTCGQSVDVICGGFPCQDISLAGKGAGLAGTRSALWSEYHRLIGELRPRYAIVENVSALLSRGLEQVLGDLASIGYDAEWHCIPASYVGAPHRRDRIWIVAYPIGHKLRDKPRRRSGARGADPAESGNDGASGPLADAYSERLPPSWAQQNGTHRKHPGGMPTTADWWRAEPDVGRVAHGIPSRVDRLRALGNAVVPQVVEVIGRAIMRQAQIAGGA